MDLHLLNHDGNIIDAASIAAIVALCHFRRPDVSVQGDEVTLVSSRDASQALPVNEGLSLMGRQLVTGIMKVHCGGSLTPKVMKGNIRGPNSSTVIHDAAFRH